MARPLFRQAALERLSSPEQLDQLMVMPAWGAWMALLAAGVILCAGLIWSLTGMLPIQVTGSGILLHGGQVLPVRAPATGQVAALRVAVGDEIQIGQVIGTLTASDSSAAVSGDLTSAVAGRVLEVLAGPGSLVGAGDSLVLLEDDRQPLMAVVYLPPAAGARLRPGMSATLVPDSASFETVRGLPGTVLSVAGFPATRPLLLRRLGSDLLADQFSAQGAPLEVLIAVGPVASGGNHTASRNPAVAAQPHGGELCSAVITLTERRPIEWLFP